MWPRSMLCAVPNLRRLTFGPRFSLRSTTHCDLPQRLRAQGVAWAQEQLSRPKDDDDDDDDDFISAEGIRAAALVAIRDGNEIFVVNMESGRSTSNRRARCR